MSWGLIVWLLCVVTITITIAYFLKQNGYSSVNSEGFTMHVCPSGSGSFINRDGETLCCNGDVIDGECIGTLRCTLSPKSKSGLSTCANLAINEAAVAGAKLCPTTMPNYFASTDSKIRGCSQSPPSPDGTMPQNPDLPHCTLYPTPALDQVKLDSCYNYTKNNELRNLAASCQILTPPAAPAAPTNPTGYVMSGDDITGEIPVHKRILIPDLPGAGAHERDQIAYVSKDSSVLRVALFRNKDIPVFSGSFPSTELPDTMDRLRELASKSQLTTRTYLIKKL